MVFKTLSLIPKKEEMREAGPSPARLTTMKELPDYGWGKDFIRYKSVTSPIKEPVEKLGFINMETHALWKRLLHKDKTETEKKMFTNHLLLKDMSGIKNSQNAIENQQAS